MIKLQVRGYSSRLGRFTLTPIVEAEYMAATGLPTQISDRYLHLGWVHMSKGIRTDGSLLQFFWKKVLPGKILEMLVRFTLLKRRVFELGVHF